MFDPQLKFMNRAFSRNSKTFQGQVSNPVIEAPKDDWRWAFLSTSRATQDIRFASYNVLADAFASTKQAKRDMFYYCAADVLSPGPRRQRILRDLLKIDADILGLQEVDTTQLAVLKPMKTLGWEHTYMKHFGILWPFKVSLEFFFFMVNVAKKCTTMYNLNN